MNDTWGSIAPDNTTNSTSEGLAWDNVLLGVILYVLVLITFVGNMIVLLAVYHEKSLQTTFNFYIVNLAITDMAVAVTAMSFYATDKMLGYWPFGSFLCGVWIFCDYGMTFASVFTLVAISTDRFWSVFWSLSYRSVNKKKKSLTMIIAVWIAMTVLWVPPLIVDRLKNTEPDTVCFWNPATNSEFVVVIALIGHHGPCVAMLFFYFRVFFYLRTRMKLRPMTTMPVKIVGKSDVNQEVSCATCDQEMSVECAATSELPTVAENPPITATTTVTGSSKADDSDQQVKPGTASTVQLSGPQPLSASQLLAQNQASNKTSSFLKVPGQQKHLAAAGKKTSTTSERPEDKRAKREMRVFVTLTYIIAGYLICWVPFHVVFDISAIKPELVPLAVYDITFWLTYLNSTINPFLYNYSSPEFRNAFRRIILRKRGSSTNSNGVGTQRTPSV